MTRCFSISGLTRRSMHRCVVSGKLNCIRSVLKGRYHVLYVEIPATCVVNVPNGAYTNGSQRDRITCQFTHDGTVRSRSFAILEPYYKCLWNRLRNSVPIPVTLCPSGYNYNKLLLDTVTADFYDIYEYTLSQFECEKVSQPTPRKTDMNARPTQSMGVSLILGKTGMNGQLIPGKAGMDPPGVLTSAQIFAIVIGVIVLILAMELFFVTQAIIILCCIFF